MKKHFPDAVIVTFHLGSDQNNQVFAFIRISYADAGGRSRTIGVSAMAFKMERSSLSLAEVSSASVHLSPHFADNNESVGTATV